MRWVLAIRANYKTPGSIFWKLGKLEAKDALEIVNRDAPASGEGPNI